MDHLLTFMSGLILLHLLLVWALGRPRVSR